MATGDPIPGLTPVEQTYQQLHVHVYGPQIPSDYWQYTAAEDLVWVNPLILPWRKAAEVAKIAFAYHGDKQTYSSVGSLFDNDPGYQDIKNSIRNFSGNVTQTWPPTPPAHTGGFA